MRKGDEEAADTLGERRGARSNGLIKVKAQQEEDGRDLKGCGCA